MKEKFGGKLDVKIYTTDSEEAKGYAFKSSANVLFQNDWVPLEVALSNEKMESYLKENLKRY
ncbi:MAG: hypothetical protein ISS65_00200 [Desulfobacterales bacterium]|uniref:Uncharacterized protein n=1 Tax=Candidatus Desulfatibia profunda TaxID=2841695 RepID=A0A8J6NSC8_9BACT|nr:hypothetical protein [Candidatus Desulfatibia profunda]MBL7178618.1 hypothetical protein [Desulfobacterales bacterium]